MVAVRLDRRVAARVDPSDVVQEALGEAARKLPQYLRDPNVAFYPWLREIAAERLVQVHRHHVRVKKRSVISEEPLQQPLPDESVSVLAEQLVAIRRDFTIADWASTQFRADKEGLQADITALLAAGLQMG